MVAAVLAAVSRTLPETPPAAGGSTAVAGPLGDTLTAELETGGVVAVGTGVGTGAAGSDPEDAERPPPPPPPQLHNTKITALSSAPRA